MSDQGAVKETVQPSNGETPGQGRGKFGQLAGRKAVPSSFKDAPPASGQLPLEKPAPKPASTAAPAAPAAPRPSRDSDSANGLLNLERQARLAGTDAELQYLIVNGSRAAVPYRQAAILLHNGPKKFKVTAVSSLAAVDRNSTFIRWLENTAASKLADENGEKIVSIDVRQSSERQDVDARTYPFPQFAFLPLSLRDGTVFGYLLLTREAEWDEASLVAAGRICETYSHAWEALKGPSKLGSKKRSKSIFVLSALGGIVACGFIPLPLTVLAPAEVTPANPYVVTAPIDGVIRKVEVEPNASVEKGQILFRYTDTELRNRLQLAGQAVGVAEARLTQSLRTSFSDPKAKRELSIAQSELELKAGEYDYASDLLEQAVVKADRSGLVIFQDKDSWTGRPVSTGERIMRIASPSEVDMTIQVPVADAIVLIRGAPVQLYLDSDPLKSVSGELVSATFHAQPDAGGVLSYKAHARFSLGETKPRIGLRGTARVHGETVRLYYYLLRKPLAAIRQWTGI